MPEMHVADDSRVLEGLQVAVHRGGVERALLLACRAHDRIHRQRPVGREQRLQDRAAGHRYAQVLSAQRRDRAVDVLELRAWARGGERHDFIVMR